MISGVPVLVLRFASESVWRDCCDAGHMQRQWGQGMSRRVSRRLQQLEAMSSLSDLDFMPFDSYERESGVVEVAVDDDAALLIEPAQQRQREDGPMHATIIVTALRVRSTAGRP